MPLHMIKLCVGVDSVEDLIDWREKARKGEPVWRVTTRQTPKRAAEMLEGGSLYWVIKGVVQCRQTILGVETVGEGKESRCEVLVSSEIVRTAPLPRRPFQGWRYLEAKDAPADRTTAGDAEVPEDLAQKLIELGAW